MAVVSSSISSSQPKQLRPFDARRDMLPVANLIESCFSSSLDPDGRRYLGHMRSVAKRSGRSRWISLAYSTNTIPMAGFVWEEAGVLVGNLSLIPFISQGSRIFLIANVAVHPDYRRKGIARALTTAALTKSQKRFASATWLQVRHNNQAALDLYTKMGFSPRAQRTSWVASPRTMRGEPPLGIRVTFRRSSHWSLQRSWLDQNYPPALRWHFPLKQLSLKPGILGWLYRFFNEIDVRHWSVERDQKLLGVVSWQGSRRYADNLWLAAPPQQEDLVLSSVLPYIHRERTLSRPVALDLPDDRAAKSLADTGFEKTSTLIWMETRHDRRIL
jgi:GNAT superfamily N-acetyltransferase